ncbi:MAG: hypothetical protein HND57_02635 [Planctomycetes bacterium]|nr:hypothetical protein [Planctomycetota bacterium]
MKRSHLILPQIAVLTLVACTASAQMTWWVNDNAEGDPGHGSCWESDPLEDGSEAHPFDAIQEAVDASSAGDTIKVKRGTYSGDCGNKNIVVPCHALTIESVDGPDLTFIDGGLDGRAFIITGDGPDDPVIKGFTIRYCKTDDSGGAVYCLECDPQFINCYFTTNWTKGHGGAAMLDRSDATFESCYFWDNRGLGGVFDSDGGAIFVTDNEGTASATNCEFDQNTTTSGGGAVHLSDAGMTFVQCDFKRNEASGGGAVKQSGRTSMSVFDACEFGTAPGDSANKASVGGALNLHYGGTCDIRNGTVFADNRATTYGGAVSVSQTDLTITDSFFERCAVTLPNGAGGAIYCFGADLDIVNTAFIENTASISGGQGGGLYIADNVPDHEESSAVIEASLFDQNASAFGGGGIFSSGADLTISTTIFDTNTSSGGRGGGIRLRDEAASTISGSDFLFNTAKTDGGAIANTNQSSLIISNSAFANNGATSGDGGAIYTTGASMLSLDVCTFDVNTSLANGGAVSSSDASPLDVADSDFTLNTATTGNGGGLYIEDAPAEVMVNGSTFTGNQAPHTGIALQGGGGGIATLRADISVSGTHFQDNGSGLVGGGILSDSGETTVTDCMFGGNNTVLLGGGLFSYACPSVTIESCVFDGNSTSDGVNDLGGGAYVEAGPVTVNASTFVSNASTLGGGLATYLGSASVTSSDFISNDASGAGGGSWHQADPVVNVVDYQWCRFSDNIALTGGGGAVSVNHSDSTFHNCDFRNNYAFDNGGAISSWSLTAQTAEVANCLFHENTVDLQGGAVAINCDGDHRIVNCTLSRNKALGISGVAGGIWTGFGTMMAANNIFWENEDSAGNHFGAQIDGSGLWLIEYSCFTDPACPDPLYTNICADPKFRNVGAVDYRLLPLSPCVDAGNNNFVPYDTLDLDANGHTLDELTPLDLIRALRFIDVTIKSDSGTVHSDPAFSNLPIVDIGAYESLDRPKQSGPGNRIDADGAEGIPW